MLGPIGMHVSSISLSTSTMRQYIPLLERPPLEGDVLFHLLGHRAEEDDGKQVDNDVSPYAKVMLTNENLTPAEAMMVLMTMKEFNPLHAIRTIGLFIADHWQTVVDRIHQSAITPWLAELRQDTQWAELEERMTSEEAQFHVAWQFARHLLKSLAGH